MCLTSSQESLTRCIREVYPLNVQAINDLLAATTEHTCPSGYKLIRHGEVCSDIYFVVKGALRSYYTQHERQYTNWFAFEHSFVSSFYSVISGQPGYEIIELLEESILLKIPQSTIDQLIRLYPAIGQLYRRILERYYLENEQRLTSLQFATAQEKYDELVQHFPHLLQRVALGHIASYLGITPETLSRIRSRK